jgi:hypothetical protein
MMEKLSTAKVAQVLEDTQRALLELAKERDKYAAENAALKTRAEAEKLATVMHSKGCRLDVEHGELVSELEKAAEDGRLPVLQEAVDMVAPNMGLAGPITSDDVPGGGTTSLEGYIIGNVG